MSQTVGGLFINSQRAGEAISELMDQGYTEEISLVAKDDDTGEITKEKVKENVSDGAKTGATAGGVLGALTGVIAGTISVVIPGIGTFLVAGPLTLLWGLTGGALGALSGGLVGALVDAGFPEKKAEVYEEHILKGEVFVAVTTQKGKAEKVVEIMERYGVIELAVIEAAE